MLVFVYVCMYVIVLVLFKFFQRSSGLKRPTMQDVLMLLGSLRLVPIISWGACDYRHGFSGFTVFVTSNSNISLYTCATNGFLVTSECSCVNMTVYYKLNNINPQSIIICGDIKGKTKI